MKENISKTGMIISTVNCKLISTCIPSVPSLRLVVIDDRPVCNFVPLRLLAIPSMCYGIVTRVSYKQFPSTKSVLSDI